MKKIKWIKSDKFNQNQLCIKFMLPLDDIEINYTCLSYIICTLTEKYNTESKLINKQNNLYGTSIRSSYYISNKVVILEINMLFPNPSYIDDDKYVNDIFEYLEESLYHPLLNDTKEEFDDKNFIKIQRRIKDQINSLYDNKDAYAINELIKHMQRNDEVYLPVELSIEDYQKLENKNVYKLYKRFINESDCFVIGMGNVEESIVKSKIDSFNLPEKHYDFEYLDNFVVTDVKEKLIIETQDIKQSRIVFGLRTDIKRGHYLYPSYILMLEMFGGNFISTLNNIIREKMSLAYSISSFGSDNRNISFIFGGVENSNVEKAISVIKNELDNYKKGKVEDGKMLLNVAKEDYESFYRSRFDSIMGYLTDASYNFIPHYYTSKELHDLVMNVKLKDIYETANHLFVDTIYVLKGETK